MAEFDTSQIGVASPFSSGNLADPLNQAVSASTIAARPAGQTSPGALSQSVPNVSLANTAAPQATVPQLSMLDIYNDPTILAFLRSSGLAEQVAANDVARRQMAINQATSMALHDMDVRGEDARRGIREKMETRGLSHGGQSLTEQARQEAAQARAQGALQFQAQNQINDLSGNLQTKIAENQMRASELGTQAYMDNALSTGKSAIDSKYSGGTGVYGTEDE